MINTLHNKVLVLYQESFNCYFILNLNRLIPTENVFFSFKNTKIFLSFEQFQIKGSEGPYTFVAGENFTFDVFGIDMGSVYFKKIKYFSQIVFNAFSKMVLPHFLYFRLSSLKKNSTYIYEIHVYFVMYYNLRIVTLKGT